MFFSYILVPRFLALEFLIKKHVYKIYKDTAGPGLHTLITAADSHNSTSERWMRLLVLRCGGPRRLCGAGLEGEQQGFSWPAHLKQRQQRTLGGDGLGIEALAD